MIKQFTDENQSIKIGTQISEKWKILYKSEVSDEDMEKPS